MVGNLVVRIGLSPNPSRDLFHSRGIASQEGCVVGLDSELIEHKFSIERQLNGLLRLVQLVEVLIAASQNAIRNRKVRIELDGFPGFFDRL